MSFIGDSQEQSKKKNFCDLIPKHSSSEYILYLISMPNYSLQQHLKNPFEVEKLRYSRDPLLRNCNSGTIPFKQLSLLVGISPESVRQSLGRAQKSHNGDIRTRSQGRPRKFTAAQTDLMTSNEMLVQQSGKTLEERCREFNQLYDLKVSVRTLRRLYKERHIQLKLGGLNNFYHAGAIDDQLLKIVELQQKVTYLTECGFKLIYCDETVFGRSNILRRDWRKRKQVFLIKDKRQSMQPQAVLGGISSERGLERIYIVPKSIKGVIFLKFVRDIEELNPGGRIALFVDNARMHYGKQLRDHCAESGTIIVYSVPYSPYLNPIERYWSVAKSRFKREMMKNCVLDNGESCKELLDRVILGIDNRIPKQIALSGHRSLCIQTNL